MLCVFIAVMLLKPARTTGTFENTTVASGLNQFTAEPMAVIRAEPTRMQKLLLVTRWSRRLRLIIRGSQCTSGPITTSQMQEEKMLSASTSMPMETSACERAGKSLRTYPT